MTKMTRTKQQNLRDDNFTFMLEVLRNEPSLQSVPAAAVKRLIDLCVATAGLIILSPLMLVAGILIKVFSPGPLLFKQKRIGERGALFEVVKFRTMHTMEAYPELFEMAENEQPFIKLKDDPRVFPFGNLLRKLSLDELPQLFNILIGNMSLVGPRPLVEEEVSLCDERQVRRLLAKPGLTGWAQINGRTDVTFDGLMELDLAYIENRSLLFDLVILLKTVKVVVTREGAY